MIVYKITNRINGKVYIGQTTRPLMVRWKQHCNPSNQNCIALHRAILKYGKENFTIEQIDVASDLNELNQKEIYWIKFYNSIDPNKGYNLRIGGENGTVSNETRVKLGKGNRGKKFSEEWRRKMSKSHKGVKHSAESYAKGVETKRANGTYEKIAKIAVINGKQSGKRVRCLETGIVYKSITDAAKANGLNRVNVSECVRGIHKTCGGMRWEYVS